MATQLFNRNTPTYSFDDILDKIKEDDKGKWDELVPVRKIVYSSDGKLGIRGGEGFQSWYPMTRHAQSQFFGRLGIPLRYADRCPTEILAPHIEHWQAEYINSYKVKTGQEPTWLFRFRDQRIRGILTDEYSIFDNHHIASALIKNQELIKDYKAVLININDDGFHLRMVNPKVADDFGSAGMSDIIQGGFHIINRETGGRSTRLEYMLFRLVCANGLVGIDRALAFHQVHRGENMTERFVERFADAIGGSQNHLERLLFQMGDSRKELTHRGRDLITYLGEKNGLNEEVIEAVASELRTSSVNSRYDIINAFTAGARVLYGDSRYDVEAIGGKLLTSSIVRLEMQMLEEMAAKEAKEAKKAKES